MTREIGNMVPRSGVVFTKGEARPLTARWLLERSKQRSWVCGSSHGHFLSTKRRGIGLDPRRCFL